MNFSINITKRLVVRIAFIVAVVAAAFTLDVYFENNPAELDNMQAESKKHTSEPGGVYLIAQTGSITVKTSVQKSFSRELKVQLHDKFLRKYHSIRNYQVLQAEVVTQTTPLISSYHYLVFQNHSFSPDEDPLA